MSSLSGKDKIFYEQFKKEAKRVVVKSLFSNNTKEVIKFRGKTFLTGNFHVCFITAKEFILYQLKNHPIQATN